MSVTREKSFETTVTQSKTKDASVCNKREKLNETSNVWTIYVWNDVRVCVCVCEMVYWNEVGKKTVSLIGLLVIVVAFFSSFKLHLETKKYQRVLCFFFFFIPFDGNTNCAMFRFLYVNKMAQRVYYEKKK